MEFNLAKILKLIVFFGISASISGFIKIYLILQIFEDNLKDIAGISGYVSMLVGVITSCIILGVTAYICSILITFLKKSRVQINEFADAYNILIYILILAEVLKLFLMIIFLQDELEYLIVDENFQKTLENTNWFYFNTMVEKIFLAIGLLTFFFSFSNKRNKSKLTHIFILTFIISICLLISSIKWLK